MGHIVYGNNGVELAAFLDFFLIAGAEKAYQVRSVDMFKSAFPLFAAKLNNVPYEMIVL